MTPAVPQQVSYDNEIEVIPDTEANQDHLAVTVVEDERSSSSVKSSSPDQNVASQPLTGGKKVVRTYSKSPHYLPLALIVCIVNLPLGFLAAIFSVMSIKYGQTEESSKSATYAKLSLWLSLVGIASSIVIGIFIIMYFLVIVPNIIKLEELKT